MQFTSLVFFAFSPIVFAIYWMLAPSNNDGCGRWRLGLQNLFIVVASYVFYGWWNWKFLVLIFFTSAWAYMSGIIMDRTRIDSVKKATLILSLVVNLGILGVFKYYNFFAENIAAVLDAIGLSIHPVILKFALPVGISFYTFQALSYVIDVYRKTILPSKDLIAFLAFVSFFPQLVAGPIERAKNLLPQFLKPRHFDYPFAVDGCRQVLWGFFKKIVVADGCAFAANNLLTDNTHSSFLLLIGLFCFTIQIYGDFSGYSDIAIGISKLFGIRLMENFSFPYFSRNIGEFWRRWHISLTTWFKDYLYIPLGGSRCGLAKTIRNTFVIFLVSGFWHGASWTFITWGLIHAVAFVPSLICGNNRKFAGIALSEGRFIPSFRDACGMCATFSVVMFAWAFFRADTVGQAVGWIDDIFTNCHHSTGGQLSKCGAIQAIGWSVFMFVVEWFNRQQRYGFSIYPKRYWLRYPLYIALLLIIFLNVSPRQTFIYFQF